MPRRCHIPACDEPHLHAQLKAALGKPSNTSCRELGGLFVTFHELKEGGLTPKRLRDPGFSISRSANCSRERECHNAGF